MHEKWRKKKDLVSNRIYRGIGSLILGTGNQLELAVSCSLKAPSKVSNKSRRRKAQIALADMLLRGVVKTA